MKKLSNCKCIDILKFCYKKGKNATQATKKIAMFMDLVQYVKDASRSGRPITDKIDAIFEKVEQDQHISSYDVAEELGIDHKTVLAHLKKTGYTKKLDIWVPHELTERNLMNHVLICDSLLRRNETEPFLKLSLRITGDENWITYDKNKPGFTRNKVMLCVWWDWKGIIHYELLPPGRNIDSELYCEQLMRLKQEFGWEVLMHPPYSSDLAPSDFHLFRSLQNSLGSVRLTSREDCQNHLSGYFDQKPQNFYSNGIMSLPTRWQKVIDHNGTYIL
ncbi:hypothetical protein ABMA27_002037 [Loxostege sticticalis]|uniref:Histone-lysine N-methyltransferase SETMAR n=1 Tax=Loxostege sticticalis TaxID=481309 RepID=A0ABR3HWC4_LOXSC